MLRQPVVLANEVANLDHVAHGRLILGVGIGNNNPAVAQEFAACGVPIAAAWDCSKKYHAHAPVVD